MTYFNTHSDYITKSIDDIFLWYVVISCILCCSLIHGIFHLQPLCCDKFFVVTDNIHGPTFHRNILHIRFIGRYLEVHLLSQSEKQVCRAECKRDENNIHSSAKCASLAKEFYTLSILALI